MKTIQLGETAKYENFSENGYLFANLDVKKAVEAGSYKSGFEHFEIFGKNEHRKIYTTESFDELVKLRREKNAKIEPFLRMELDHEFSDNKYNFLTRDLRELFRIIDTDNVSANSYDQYIQSVISQYADGMVLDCGAGLRDIYYSNVYNYEIANYITTDILGVGEVLPFKDGTFDAVISIAVLEHVKDPFTCAKEISRVLKKGGTLISCIPFLQPYHGYPHHYYNMTYQGHENLYADSIVTEDIQVINSIKPIHTLTWFLQKYVDGIKDDPTREKFANMTIAEFLRSPDSFYDDDVVTHLDKRVELELAAATLLIGKKK